MGETFLPEYILPNFLILSTVCNSLLSLKSVRERTRGIPLIKTKRETAVVTCIKSFAASWKVVTAVRLNLSELRIAYRINGL